MRGIRERSMDMENVTSVLKSADGPTSIFVAGKTPEIMGALIATVVVGVIIALFGLKIVRVLSALVGLAVGAVIGACGGCSVCGNIMRYVCGTSQIWNLYYDIFRILRHICYAA